MKKFNNKYRQQYLKWHQTYEKRANTEIKRVLKAWIKAIEWENMRAGTISLDLSRAFDEELMLVAMIRIYREIGLAHGKRIGKQINDQLKEFSLVQFLAFFERTVNSFVREFNQQRVRAIKRSFIEEILNGINKDLSNGVGIKDALETAQKKIVKRDFIDWRALRIARTESTAASNYATIQSARVSGFEMQKEWISSSDSRTRRKPKDEFDHLDKNGERIGLDELFIFNDGQDKLRFPGDPKGDLSNVINCRCAIAIVPKRDKNGKLTPKS